MPFSSTNRQPTLNHPSPTQAKETTVFLSGATRLRLFLVSFVMLVCSSQTGCQVFQRFGTSKPDVPVVYETVPSQQQLLDTIHDRNRKARQLSTNVTATLPGAPKIKGTIQLEFPSRLRMKAGLLGMSEMGVDVGSNEDQFWIWTKASLPGQEPALYFADHDRFRQSAVRRAIPIDPNWLIDAIGMIEFSPNDVHHGPIVSHGGRLQLLTIRQTPSGPQTRVTLFGANSGLIEQQAIYDASNQLIAWSNSSHYKNYQQHDISLPQRIELHMIQPDGSDTKLVLEMGTYSINSLFGDPQQMWAMPNPAGIQKIDLAKVSGSQLSLRK